jgi:endonuclease/exonuclease/phosphatase family metal-dependent hydrolase
MGDFNSSPTDPSLAPLINSNLVDIMAHSKFKRDQWAGTYGDANKDDKFDYIFMSPKLSNLVNEGGIERRGVWAGRDGKKFNPLQTITKLAEAASDHAAVWVDLNI